MLLIIIIPIYSYLDTKGKSHQDVFVENSQTSGEITMQTVLDLLYIISWSLPDEEQTPTSFWKPLEEGQNKGLDHLRNRGDWLACHLPQ